MAMNAGGRGQKAEMNVTPMIDVLLVLIVIFLVITPTVSRGLNTALPQQSNAPPAAQPSREIVVSIDKDGAIAIDGHAIPFSLLADRLTSLQGLSDHIFIRGDRSLEYQAVARVIDAARGAGWDRIGLMTH